MKRKILMIGPDRGVKGGISAVVNAYFCSSLLKDYTITYISSHIDGNKLAKFIQLVRSLCLFLKYVCSKETRLVHIHSASRASFYRKSLFAIASKLWGKKLIFHIHGAMFNIFYHKESNTFGKYCIRKILLLSDSLIVLSNQWKKDLIKIVGSECNVAVIHNGVPLPAKRENYPKNGFITVLFMGRLGKRKGVYDLISAAEALVKDNAKIRFVLAGDGEVEKVRSRIKEKRMDDNFELPGWIDNKEYYFREADIYVLPSYNEGLPMSVLEAAGYGLPIISTPVGGIGEVIKDGDNGFLVTPGDVEKLKERLLELVSSTDLRIRMGLRAYFTVKERFDVEITTEQLGRVYKRLLEETKNRDSSKSE